MEEPQLQSVVWQAMPLQQAVALALRVHRPVQVEQGLRAHLATVERQVPSEALATVALWGLVAQSGWAEPWQGQAQSPWVAQLRSAVQLQSVAL